MKLNFADHIIYAACLAGNIIIILVGYCYLFSICFALSQL